MMSNPQAFQDDDGRVDAIGEDPDIASTDRRDLEEETQDGEGRFEDDEEEDIVDLP